MRFISYINGCCCLSRQQKSIKEETNPEEDNHDYSQDYLTIVSLDNNNEIKWNSTSVSNLALPIYVSTDNGSTWEQKTQISNGATLAILNNGEKLLIKGTNDSYGAMYNYSYFSSTGRFDLEGNIMSLIGGDDFANAISLQFFWFQSLFGNCSNLINAKNLVLSSLALAPYCYSSMFDNCTNLITAPQLPATLVPDYSYYQMFRNCKSLTVAPQLSATTIQTGCYNRMFEGCTNLTSITCLATDIPTTSTCTYYWVDGVAASGTFTKASGIDWTTGVSGIPEGWTVQDAS